MVLGRRGIATDACARPNAVAIGSLSVDDESEILSFGMFMLCLRNPRSFNRVVRTLILYLVISFTKICSDLVSLSPGNRRFSPQHAEEPSRQRTLGQQR